MCGLVGYLSRDSEINPHLIQEMSDLLSHRGPDSSGIWLNPHIALAHRRLSILDLSIAGHQPMISKSGRYVVQFNGEIYNHREIRALLTVEPKGRSDTETLVDAFEQWGVIPTLKYLNGMFAISVWDKESHRLFLIRDRFGEKPLYYGFIGSKFVFSSELKSFKPLQEWERKLDKDAFYMYTKYSYVPDPHCIFAGIKKLPPSHFLEFSLPTFTVNHVESYWSLNETISTRADCLADESDLDSDLEQHLIDSTKLRMESDVPMGSFLSGGIDSSLVTALMQTNSSKPTNTFSVGFDNSAYDESHFASRVADYLGCNHHCINFSDTALLDVLPKLPEIWDEPFADSSQLPTLLLSQYAREYVTVALTGDAGDEVFCGYNRYVKGYDIFKSFMRYPLPLRNLASLAIKKLPFESLDSFANLLPFRINAQGFSNKLNKLADFLPSNSNYVFYDKAVSAGFYNPTDVLSANTLESSSSNSLSFEYPPLDDFREEMMLLDSLSYLPGDILVKVDRASMSTGLETRAPFLDHTLVEWAWSQPINFKASSGISKACLRRILNKYIPDELFERPKQGFGIPLEILLRGPLLDWANNLLSEENLSIHGLYNVDQVRSLWEQHLNCSERNHHKLWNVLMFQSWFFSWNISL